MCHDHASQRERDAAKAPFVRKGKVCAACLTPFRQLVAHRPLKLSLCAEMHDCDRP